MKRGSSPNDYEKCKAIGIIKDQNLDIFCRLGGFHTLMSFFGTIENTMKGSGLEEVFETVYSEDTVTYMLSSLVFARALCSNLDAKCIDESHTLSVLILART